MAENGKKGKITGTEKEKSRRIDEMEEGEQFREPLLLGSRKEKAGKSLGNTNHMHRISSGKNLLTSQVNQQLKLSGKLCSYCWKFFLLLGTNYNDPCLLSC